MKRDIVGDFKIPHVKLQSYQMRENVYQQEDNIISLQKLKKLNTEIPKLPVNKWPNEMYRQ